MAQFSLFPLSPSSPPPAAAFRLRLHNRSRLFFQLNRIQASSDSTSTSARDLNPKVVVTRERGKNGKLIEALVYILLSLMFFLVYLLL